MKIIKFFCIVFGASLKLLYVHFMLKTYLGNTLDDTSSLDLELDDSQLEETSFDKSRYIKQDEYST